MHQWLFAEAGKVNMGNIDQFFIFAAALAENGSSSIGNHV
jgi:hypothetical protein